MKFEELTIAAFADELASNSPAPGGGSVAALCGVMAAGLTSMVGSLTVGREKFKANEAQMQKILAESEALRAKFTKLMNDDTAAFNTFMDALHLPKGTDEEKAARKTAMAEATKATTEVPLVTLETCAEIIKLSVEAARIGNPNAVSDAGCAALTAVAAGKSAAYNVRINLPGVADEAFASECRARMAAALAVLDENAKKASDILDEALA